MKGFPSSIGSGRGGTPEHMTEISFINCRVTSFPLTSVSLSAVNLPSRKTLTSAEQMLPIFLWPGNIHDENYCNFGMKSPTLFCWKAQFSQDWPGNSVHDIASLPQHHIWFVICCSATRCFGDSFATITVKRHLMTVRWGRENVQKKITSLTYPQTTRQWDKCFIYVTAFILTLPLLDHELYERNHLFVHDTY